MFTWNSVQYQFRRGPFGLRALEGQFRRVMSSIFGDWPCVRVCIDDVIVFSSSTDDHSEHLTEVLLPLNRSCLRVQPPTCRFFRPAVPYLGHVVSVQGIRIANTRVAEIANVTRPTSGKHMQPFWGMFNSSHRSCLVWPLPPLQWMRCARPRSLTSTIRWFEPRTVSSLFKR